MWTGLHSAGDKWLWSSGMEADGDIWMDTDIAPSGEIPSKHETFV